MPSKGFEPSWPMPDSVAAMDRRTRRTRMALAEALLGLLAEKPLESITVRELAEAADVNRSTFYVHFQDIYDMVHQMRRELYERCRVLIEIHGAEIERYDFGSLLRDLLEYLEDNEAVFAILSGGEAAELFGADFRECVRSTCLEVMRPLEHLGRAQRERARAAGVDLERLRDYHFDCVFGGTLGLVGRWIASGKQEPVDAMVALAAAYSDALDFNVVADRFLDEVIFGRSGR